jgi:hypothetical protein
MLRVVANKDDDKSSRYNAHVSAAVYQKIGDTASVGGHLMPVYAATWVADDEIAMSAPVRLHNCTSLGMVLEVSLVYRAGPFIVGVVKQAKLADLESECLTAVRAVFAKHAPALAAACKPREPRESMTELLDGFVKRAAAKKATASMPVDAEVRVKADREYAQLKPLIDEARKEMAALHVAAEPARPAALHVGPSDDADPLAYVHSSWTAGKRLTLRVCGRAVEVAGSPTVHRSVLALPETLRKLIKTRVGKQVAVDWAPGALPAQLRVVAANDDAQEPMAFVSQTYLAEPWKFVFVRHGKLSRSEMVVFGADNVLLGELALSAAMRKRLGYALDDMVPIDWNCAPVSPVEPTAKPAEPPVAAPKPEKSAEKPAPEPDWLVVGAPTLAMAYSHCAHVHDPIDDSVVCVNGKLFAALPCADLKLGMIALNAAGRASARVAKDARVEVELVPRGALKCLTRAVFTCAGAFPPTAARLHAELDGKPLCAGMTVVDTTCDDIGRAFTVATEPAEGLVTAETVIEVVTKA